MKLKIEAVYGANKSRKEVILEVTEDIARYFSEMFKRDNAGEESGIEVEGNNAMRVRLSFLTTEKKF